MSFVSLENNTHPWKVQRVVRSARSTSVVCLTFHVFVSLSRDRHIPVVFLNYCLCLRLSALLEAQDIFGLDFDFDEFDKYGRDDYSEEEDDYEEEVVDGEARRRKGKRKSTKKSIYEVCFFWNANLISVTREHYSSCIILKSEVKTICKNGEESCPQTCTCSVFCSIQMSKGHFRCLLSSLQETEMPLVGVQIKVHSHIL